MSGTPEGFTLPEIVISLAVFSIISLFSFEIFRIDHKVFTVQDEVVEMQQNARIALDQLVRSIRMAGSGVPQGGVNSDVGYMFSIVPGDGGGTNPDTVSILVNFKNAQTKLSDPMPNESAELKVVDASDFEVGAIAMIAGSTDQGIPAAEIFQITHISTNGQHMLQHNKSEPWNADQKLDYSFIPPSTVTMMTHCKFYIDQSDSLHPKLVLVENLGSPQVIADNMENFQVVYDLSNGEKDVPDPGFLFLIRKTTISIVARSDSGDPQWSSGIDSRTGTSDNYRRLAFTTDIQMRNLKK